MESKEIQSTLQKYLMRESQNKLQIKDKREEKSKMDNHQQSLQSKLDASKAKADKKNVVEPPKVTGNWSKNVDHIKDSNNEPSIEEKLKNIQSRLNASKAKADEKPVVEPPKVTGNWSKNVNHIKDPLGHMDKVTKMEEEVDERIRLQMKAHRQKIELVAKSLEDKVPLETADEKEKMSLKLEKDKEMIREIYRMETSKLVDAMKNQHVQQLETFRKKTQENLAEIKNSTLQIQKENKEKAMATSGPGLDGIKPSELGKEKKKTEIKIDNFRPTCLRIQAKVEEQKETAEKLESDLEKTKYKLNNLETNVELLQRRYKQLPATLTNVKEFNRKVPDLKRGDKVTNIPIASNCSIPKESAQKYSQRSSALSSTLLPKTSSTYSLDAILKEKWKKYFPSGISPLNAYAQKSGNEFGYVSAEEQVAMRQRARITEKYTDPRSITSIIEDNKRWLRKF